ncbi:HAD family hydrolase [Streptosporangium sandarakinum]|uniref:Beta-phosphoglucomutase-like phosphatase (HAD superfamily) n=1 Tax=Streptosporangium sandarakinum TaxID=1260955 RepID=A0A852UTX3_9ACTN|nr:hypothetical protein [Streptosporangium sandarakinum]NYF39679.1 beta-phosphoglucomutase-like phosphatase (HAD superfamily) [Streptosporangium sandarakinum]
MPRLDLRTVGTVLLDMDGTLVERAWRTWAREYGVPAEAVLAHAHGDPADRTVRLLLPGLDDAAVGHQVYLPSFGDGTVEGQAGDPASHLNAVIRLPAARRGQALLPAAL